jgi:hypothetical protein
MVNLLCGYRHVFRIIAVSLKNFLIKLVFSRAIAYACVSPAARKKWGMFVGLHSQKAPDAIALRYFLILRNDFLACDESPTGWYNCAQIFERRCYPPKITGKDSAWTILVG